MRSMLWQTGYLTIKEVQTTPMGIRTFTLGIPNIEVQYSLNEIFLYYFTGNRDTKLTLGSQAETALEQANIDDLIRHLQALFAGIPYNNYVNNEIATAEGFWASLVFVFFSAIGYRVSAEDVTNQGRIDLSLETFTDVFIIEFKVDMDEKPLAQIERRRYWEKYTSLGKRIRLVGIIFDSKERNITAWESREV